jgi:hypothetical protein
MGMKRSVTAGLLAGLALAVSAAPAGAAPTFADGNFAGVSSEGRALSFAIAGGGTRVTDFHFVNPCFEDQRVGVAVPATMKIQTTTTPKKRKGAKRKPKPKPLAEPIFGYQGGGFTIKGTFKSSTHAEGTFRWVTPAGCDTGTLGFDADVVVQPS